jgi:cell division protein FtsL
MINSYTARNYRSLDAKKQLHKASSPAINLIVMAVLFLSSFGLVYIKYQTQQSYIRQADLAKEWVDFNQDHQQLMLELAAISSNSRVYESTKNMGMVIPGSREIVVI